MDVVLEVGGGCGRLGVWELQARVLGGIRVDYPSKLDR